MSNRIALLALTIAMTFGAAHARADEAAAWAALRAGGHIALMRHTDAPGGAGDPPGFKVEDCTTQRNLSDQGRIEAAQIGRRLKAEGIMFEKILSSPWCRCVDTARLLDMGAVDAAATFGNVVVLRDQTETLTEGARTLIEGWRGAGTLLVVTHGANIRTLTGISPATGEIVVVDRSTEAVGRIPSRR